MGHGEGVDGKPCRLGRVCGGGVLGGTLGLDVQGLPAQRQLAVEAQDRQWVQLGLQQLQGWVEPQEEARLWQQGQLRRGRRGVQRVIDGSDHIQYYTTLPFWNEN